jgi:REP-associated tyrosine transposase
MILRSPTPTRTQYNPEIHHRRSIRLKHYDYSRPGAYLVTLCVQNRVCIFGEIVDGIVRLSPAGRIARDSWLTLSDHFENVLLDEFIVMPNHIHGILFLTPQNTFRSDYRRGLINQTPTGAHDKWILMRNPKPTLGKILRRYKARTSKLIHDQGHVEFRWQRNYYERVIRDDVEMHRIREYITGNPAGWLEDEENPAHFVARATGRSPVP